MASSTSDHRRGAATEWIRTAIWGPSGSRVRAIWRVLLAMPVFWILGGGVFAGNVQTAIDAIPPGSDPLGGLAFSLLHGGFVVVALVGWAQYLDRRPLRTYGVSVSPSWGADFLLGLGAVFVAFGVWFGVASAAGWASVEVATSAPQGPLLVGLGLFVVTLAIHVWIQQLVFFRIIVASAAEGLHGHGLSARRAVLAGVLVALPFFVGMHQLRIDLRFLDLAVVGLIYGLLYAHTGELALGIGLHLGIFVAGQVLFVPAAAVTETTSVLAVTQSLPEPLAVLGAYGFPKMLIAYALVVAYLVWRRGELPVESEIVQWNDG